MRFLNTTHIFSMNILYFYTGTVFWPI